MNDGTPAPQLSAFDEPTNVGEWDALHAQTRRLRAGQPGFTQVEFGAMLTRNDLTLLLHTDMARKLRWFSDYDEDDLRQELYLCGLELREAYDEVDSIAEWLSLVGPVHLRHKLRARRRIQNSDGGCEEMFAAWNSSSDTHDHVRDSSEDRR